MEMFRMKNKTLRVMKLCLEIMSAFGNDKSKQDISEALEDLKNYIDKERINLIIRVGDHVKTTKEYENNMYEPLYMEKILDGIILDIDESDVTTIQLIDSSCDFGKKFNYHMNSWTKGNLHKIGLGWLELVE